MVTMRVTFFEKDETDRPIRSPVKVLVDGKPYTVTFEHDPTVLVPRPIGLVLVTMGLARDFGSVTGVDRWPRVTPAWH